MSPPVSSNTHSLSALRRQLRQRRQQLSPFQQQHAARRLTHRLRRTPTWQGARHVALYLAIDGEIQTTALLRLALTQSKRCYLPVLYPVLRQPRLLFVPVTKHSRLRLNRWGIAEPVASLQRRIHIRRLHLMLVPLTGFDRQGHRLGMGKGFYDRALAERAGRRWPRLTGLAHECQYVQAGLPKQPWDVDMDAVVTPEGMYGRLESYQSTCHSR